MSYIIVFRNCHRDPFVHTDSHGFKEMYSTYEQAKEEAEQVKYPKDNHYFDYQIYEEVES